MESSSAWKRIWLRVVYYWLINVIMHTWQQGQPEMKYPPLDKVELLQLKHTEINTAYHSITIWPEAWNPGIVSTYRPPAQVMTKIHENPMWHPTPAVNHNPPNSPHALLSLQDPPMHAGAHEANVKITAEGWKYGSMEVKICIKT